MNEKFGALLLVINGMILSVMVTVVPLKSLGLELIMTKLKPIELN